MEKKKRRKKSERTLMIEKLDRLWSIAVRTRDRFQCQKSPCPAHGKYMHGAHIWERGNMLVRWDVDDGITMCYYHHLHWAHRKPLEFAEWIKERIGSRKYYALRKKSDNPEGITITMKDMERTEKKLLRQIKEFEECNENEPF